MTADCSNLQERFVILKMVSSIIVSNNCFSLSQIKWW